MPTWRRSDPRGIGITIAFSLGPAFFDLLKCVARIIYPLNQKRVDEIEKDLTARRAALTPSAPTSA
jgi:GPH family glycoside/pentoside/hexuronide:cation symporter